jgi:AcrR family transcriptional regulator
LPALSTNRPNAGRIDIGRIRREQIVEAAVGIIVRQGLPSLSLSKIERAAGMKRGQLTYYFPTKEDILLAVFDRLLLLMYQQIERSGQSCQEKAANHTCWQCVQQLLQAVLGPEPFGPEFHALQYTFLAQIAHRDDFRKRLASLYEEWRNGLAEHWRATAHPVSPLAAIVSPRSLASFVQALVHGLLVQRAADPNAFDRTEMLALCVGVLAPLFTGGEAVPIHPRGNGHPRRPKEKFHG